MVSAYFIVIVRGIARCFVLIYSEASLFQYDWQLNFSHVELGDFTHVSMITVGLFIKKRPSVAECCVVYVHNAFVKGSRGSATTSSD